MKISELVIACFNINEMVIFYQNVFSISFSEVKIPQGVIYEAKTEDMKIILCPATIARITAKDNRQQLTFQIDDVKSSIEKVRQFGGSIISELQEIDNYLQVAVRDIDDNSIILRQNFKST